MASERRELNPFATSRTRPGAIPYRFASDDELARQLAAIALHPAMQIVGAHGIGKSTLVRTLLVQIAARGWQCSLLRIGPGQRRWRKDQIETNIGASAADDMREVSPRVEFAATPTGACLFVDGYEQLSWWSKRTLRTAARRNRQTLIVTCHDDVGLPVLARPEVSVALLTELADALQAGYPRLVSNADVEQLWARHPGHAREILFGLYDLYETRRASAERPDHS